MKKIQLGGYKKPYKIKGYALIDDSDFDLISQFKWHLTSGGYAETNMRPSNKKPAHKINMHRLIMNTPKGLDTDHIDGNRLNNQKNNLRVCTHQQNTMNCKLSKRSKSGITGVRWDKSRKQWKAELSKNRVCLLSKRFKSKKDALDARKQAEIKYFGEFTHNTNY